MAPEGRAVTYREFVASGLSPRMLAQAILERSAGEKIAEVYLSPDAFAKRTSEATIAEQIGDVLAGGGLPRPSPADDDRVGGWMLLYQLLESDQWLIADHCRKLIACLPALTRDEGRVEDVLKMEGDDPADAARYGLKSRLRPGRPPLVERVLERVTLTDPTSRAIQIARLLHEEQRRAQPVRLARPRRWRPGAWWAP
jgi:broad specificity phosphatase PhoE